MTIESGRHGSIQRRVAPTSQLPEIVPGHRLDIPQSSLSITAVGVLKGQGSQVGSKSTKFTHRVPHLIRSAALGGK